MSHIDISGLAGAQKDQEHKILKNKNLQVALAVTFLSVLGISSITSALPEIATAFNIPKKNIGIIVTMYSIPSAFVSPIIGIISDRFGRKKVLVPSLFLFGLTGGLCALARNLKTLICLRLFQGLGAAGLSTLNVTLIGDTFEGKKRTEALGYYTSVIAIGLGLLPIIGGALAMYGWKYPFILHITGIPLGCWVFVSLEDSKKRFKQDLKDYMTNSYQSLIKNWVLATFAIGLITYIILYGAIFTYFPVLAKERFGATSLVIGIVMASMSMATVLTDTQLSKIVKRFTEHGLVKTAAMIYGVGLLAMAYTPGIWFYTIPLAVFGVAHGINLPCIQTLIAKFAPEENRAVFMSLNSVIFRAGQAFGPLIMGLFYSRWGINAVFLAGTAFCIIIGLFVIPISRYENRA